MRYVYSMKRLLDQRDIMDIQEKVKEIKNTVWNNVTLEHIQCVLDTILKKDIS